MKAQLIALTLVLLVSGLYVRATRQWKCLHCIEG